MSGVAVVVHNLPADERMANASCDELADRLELAYSRGEAAPWRVVWEMARRALQASGSLAADDPPRPDGPGSPHP